MSRCRPQEIAQLAASGLEFLRPDPAERDEINRIIMEELVYGTFKPEAIA